MVYAEWQLLRQLQMASAWTDEPTVALPQVPENWAAAEQRLDPGSVEPSQAEKTRYAQTDAAQAQPGQLLQALEQGRYQMSAAAVTVDGAIAGFDAPSGRLHAGSLALL